MKGLILYYYYILRYKCLAEIAGCVVVAWICATQNMHDLAIIYFVTTWALLIAFDGEKESAKNALMEKMLPLQKHKIIGLKYLMLIVFVCIGALVAWIYLAVVENRIDPGLDGAEIKNLLCLVVSISLSAGAVVLYNNQLGEGRKKWYRYGVCALQLAIGIGCSEPKLLPDWLSQQDWPAVLRGMNLALALVTVMITFYKVSVGKHVVLQDKKAVCEYER